MTARANGLNENLHLHRLAAAQVPRNVTLRWSFKETGLTHVVRSGETRLNSSNRYVAGARRSVGMYWHEQQDVPACRIDDVLSSLSGLACITWMKVDVEVRCTRPRIDLESFCLSSCDFFLQRSPNPCVDLLRRRATSWKPSAARGGSWQGRQTGWDLRSTP